MKRKVFGLALVMMILGIMVAGSEAQQPGKKDGPPPGKKGDQFGKKGDGKKGDGFGKGGPPSGLVRAVDDLRLPERQRETVVAAVRDYEDDGRRLAEMAGANLLLKMKDIV